MQIGSKCLAPSPADQSVTTFQPATMTAVIPGSVLPKVRSGATIPLSKQLPEEMVLHLQLVFRIRNAASFAECLGAINDPRSSDYGRFLNATTLQPYLPTPGQKSSMVSFFVSHGFAVNSSAPSSPLAIELSAPAQTIQQVFGVSLVLYKADNITFYAIASDPKLPENFASVTQGIIGLDNYTRIVSFAHSASLLHPCWGPYCPQGLQVGYGFSSLYASGYDGTGQKVAIVIGNDEPNPQSAINTYDSEFGLASTSLSIYTDGSTNPAGFEGDMDVSAVHAMAPGAQIILVHASDANLFSAINYVASNHLAPIVSNSWGLRGCDTDYPQSQLNAYDSFLASDVAQGVTILFASGDDGARPDGTHYCTHFPASDPNVLSVGGTDLSLTSCGYYNCSGYGSEDGWSSSGGGYSGAEPEPSWQVAALGITNGRGVPDVSILGGSPGIWVYNTQLGWGGQSGTSLSTPLWAGFLAVALQVRGGGSYGNVGPLIYQLASGTSYSVIFHDISSGNNGYATATGWDPVTGWGSPIGNSLAGALAQKQVRTDKSTYAQGDSISYTGSGFTALGSIQACLSTDNDGSVLCISEPNADQYGNAAGTMYVGTNIPPGQQKFYLTDLTTGLSSMGTQLTITQYLVCTYVTPTSIGATFLLGGNAYSDGQLAPIVVGIYYSLQAQVPNGYSFAGWTVTRGTVSVTDPSSPSTTVIFGSGGWDGTCVGNLNVNYYPQITITSSPGTGPGFITVDGTPQTAPYIVVWQPGSTHTISATTTVSCGTACQYAWTSWSDAGGQSHTITAPSLATSYTAYSKTQYQLTINLNGHGVGSPPNSGTWYDSGSSVQVTIGSDASSNSTTKRYVYNGAAGVGSGSYTGSSSQFLVTMNAPVTETVAWQTQYTLNVALNGYGTSMPASGGWYSSGSNLQVTIGSDSTSNSSTTRYLYNGATGGGGGSYTGLGNPFSVTMNAPITEGIAWKAQFNVTITDSGVGPDTGSATIVIVKGVSYQQSQLPFTGWFDASTFSYSYQSPVSGSGLRYAWVSVSGLGQSLQSNTFTLGSAGVLTGAYNTQYQLTVNLNGYGASSPSSGQWYNSGQNVQVTIQSDHSSNSTNTRHLYSSVAGSGLGSYSGSSNPFSVTMNAAITESLTWRTQYALTVALNGHGTSTAGSGSWYDPGTPVTVTIGSDAWSNSSSTRFLYSGITGSGSGSYSGLNNPFTVMMNAPVTESIAWQIQYSLAIMLNGHGTSTPTTGGWYNSSASFQVTIGSDGGSNSSNTRYLYKGATGSGSGSFTGSSNPFTVTMNAPVSESISWTTQYTLTITLNGYGTSNPSDGWYTSGTPVAITISSDSSNSSTLRRVIGTITGTGTGSYSGTKNPFSVTMNSPISEAVTWQVQYPIIISLNGHGTSMPGSGSWHNSGALITISVESDASSNSSAIRYLYSSVSGSGTSSYSGPNNPFTVTMNEAITEIVTWQTQYSVTITLSGHGMSSPPSGSWYNPGANVIITISSDPSSNSSSTRFLYNGAAGSGPGSYTGPGDPFSVTANGPITESIAWMTQYTISMYMNGHGISTPTSGTWEDSGTTLPVTIGDDGTNSTITRYVISSITGTGGGSYTGSANPFTVTMNAPITESVTWATQYMLSMNVNPDGGGVVTPSSGWRNPGSSITLSANAATGYAFSSWNGTGSGSYSGFNDPASITTNGPINETANFHPLMAIQLQAGWNLISLPIVPNSTSITKLLRWQIAAGEISSVWRYSASSHSWQVFTPGKAGTLTTMTDGNGYWVNMKTSDTLYVDGNVIAPGSTPPTYSLVQGWNLVGFKPQPTVRSESVGQYLSSLGGKYEPNNVWVYTATGWVRADVDYMLQPGEAMWILMEAPGTLRP